MLENNYFALCRTILLFYTGLPPIATGEQERRRLKSSATGIKAPAMYFPRNSLSIVTFVLMLLIYIHARYRRPPS